MPPRHRGKPGWVFRARGDVVQRRHDPRSPNVPFLFRRIGHSRQQSKHQVLDVRANVIVRKQLADFGQIPLPVRVTEVDEDLPDLRATEQMLLRGLEEGRERLPAADESSCETVVEEALVTESVAASVEGQDTLGGHSSQVFRRTSVQFFSGD